jgi:hypothetical protein
MFARILEFVPKMEKKEEFVRVIKNEVMPILRKQTGFLEVLHFFPEITTEKARFVTLWTEKKHFERYEKEWYPKVEAIVKPYLMTPPMSQFCTLETTLCEHFEKAVVA